MKCSIEGCDRKVSYAGLCGMHYKRKWRHGDVNTNLTPPLKPKYKCSVDDCETLTTHNSGMCELHLHRFVRYGRTERIVGLPGLGTINRDGYVVFNINGVPTYEHILKAEKALGRPLPKGAVVHHMNRKPWDNDTPLNLVICPDQGYHLLLHRRMKELGYEDN